MKSISFGGSRPGPWHRQGLNIIDANDKVVGRAMRAVDAEIAASAVEALAVLASMVMATAGAIERYEDDKGPNPPEAQMTYAAAGAVCLAGAMGHQASPDVKAFTEKYAEMAAYVGGLEQQRTLTAELHGARRNLIMASALRIKPFLPR